MVALFKMFSWLILFLLLAGALFSYPNLSGYWNYGMHKSPEFLVKIIRLSATITTGLMGAKVIVVGCWIFKD